jgi:hypothetical protein
MTQAKQASKRKRRSKAVVLGAAGLLSLAGGGAATQAAPAADIPARHVEPSHELTLSEEEVSDVSLATFYVFDKERTAPPAFTLARACGRCGGCARCAAGRCAVGRCAVGRCVVGRCAVGACTGCGGGCGTGYCYSTGGCNAC